MCTFLFSHKKLDVLCFVLHLDEKDIIVVNLKRIISVLFIDSDSTTVATAGMRAFLAM